VNPRETLETILGIRHGANIESAPGDDGLISLSADSNTEAIHNDALEGTHDLQVRLSAFVAYCRLGMSCLSNAALTKSEKRTVEENEITERVLNSVDVPFMLSHEELAYQGRAYAALPALC
jgi:hypothetical protein